MECDVAVLGGGPGGYTAAIRAAQIGVEFDPRKGIAADEHRRTTQQHIYAVGDCAGYWQLAHTAFREGEVAAENALGHDATVDNRGVPRPIYTDPEIAGVGLTEQEAPEHDRPSIDDVLRALSRLPFNQRSALVMRELEGRSCKEIAEMLGLSVSAVEALLFRARQRLQIERKALGVLGTAPLPGQ